MVVRPQWQNLQRKQKAKNQTKRILSNTIPSVKTLDSWRNISLGTSGPINPGSDSKLKSFCDISITQMAVVSSPQFYSHHTISTIRAQITLDLTDKQFRQLYHKVVGQKAKNDSNNSKLFNNKMEIKLQLVALQLKKLKRKEKTVKLHNGLSFSLWCFWSTKISRWYELSCGTFFPM